jgi:hypothetical protein
MCVFVAHDLFLSARGNVGSSNFFSTQKASNLLSMTVSIWCHGEYEWPLAGAIIMLCLGNGFALARIIGNAY